MNGVHTAWRYVIKLKHSHLQLPASSSLRRLRKAPSPYRKCSSSELKSPHFSVQPLCYKVHYLWRKVNKSVRYFLHEYWSRHIGFVVYNGSGNTSWHCSNWSWPPGVSLTQWKNTLMDLGTWFYRNILHAYWSRHLSQCECNNMSSISIFCVIMAC